MPGNQLLLRLERSHYRQRLSSRPIIPGKEIVIYQTVDGKTSIDVRFENDTVWLTQDQMKTLFQRDKSVISRHIRDIFNEGELDPEVVVAKNATTTRHGAIADKTQTQEK